MRASTAGNYCGLSVSTVALVCLGPRQHVNSVSSDMQQLNRNRGGCRSSVQGRGFGSMCAPRSHGCANAGAACQQRDSPPARMQRASCCTSTSPTSLRSGRLKRGRLALVSVLVCQPHIRASAGALLLVLLLTSSLTLLLARKAIIYTPVHEQRRRGAAPSAGLSGCTAAAGRAGCH